MYKDDPTTIYYMKHAANGHWLVPLTREAFEECGYSEVKHM